MDVTHCKHLDALGFQHFLVYKSQSSWIFFRRIEHCEVHSKVSALTIRVLSKLV
jgi:hypothetical protein